MTIAIFIFSFVAFFVDARSGPRWPDVTWRMWTWRCYSRRPDAFQRLGISVLKRTLISWASASHIYTPNNELFVDVEHRSTIRRTNMRVALSCL
ncbi:hypothetical protein J6590_064608 [Homalodisca vitripennis]|nr:hypothetical protein J6590_064608 [Homalodisca vitripennis]